jgi:hypothetical protein
LDPLKYPPARQTLIQQIGIFNGKKQQVRGGFGDRIRNIMANIWEHAPAMDLADSDAR